jgi:predicted unusual protein kinase regulating ubiquinone biosynthesis (AarF/ABC1/UbiB family)
MTQEERIIFAKLIVALARDDKEEIIRLYSQEMGFQTKFNNPDLVYRHACFYCDRDTDDITMGKNMHLFLEWMEHEDPVVQLPEEYLMASRVTLMMRGMAKAFGLEIKISEIWKDDAEKYLLSQGIQY